jgi:hypothetical protein
MHLAANWQVNWAKVFDDMMRIDSRTPEQIHTVCKWARNDPFWSRNFMSPTKLREKKNEVQYFDAFLVKMKGTNGNIAAATKAATEHGQFSMTEEQRNRLVWDSHQRGRGVNDLQERFEAVFSSTNVMTDDELGQWRWKNEIVPRVTEGGFLFDSIMRSMNGRL